MADIQMPQLGETVTEGTITKWFKQVGEQVAEDEPLFEVSTDKVDSEVPSPMTGVLSEILVPEGETVDVGVVLARIGDAPAGGGEGTEQASTAEQPPAEAPAEPEAPVEQQPEAPADAEPAPVPGAESVAQQPELRQEPTEAQPAPAAAAPEAPTAAPRAPTAEGAPASNGRLLSPVVRRLISENNLDPAAIVGTGPGGRITRNDVLSVLDQGGAVAAAPAAPAQPEAPPQPAPAQPAAAPAPAPTAPTAQPAARAGSATPPSPTPTSGGAPPST